MTWPLHLKESWESVPRARYSANGASLNGESLEARSTISTPVLDYFLQR